MQGQFNHAVGLMQIKLKIVKNYIYCKKHQHEVIYLSYLKCKQISYKKNNKKGLCF